MTGRALLLALDCAGSYLATALVARGGPVVAERSRTAGRDHAALIVPELEELFAGAGVTDPRNAIGGIVVGAGPGSYTGIRVGVSTARGLAHAWSVPLSGASSLLALAGRHADPGESVVAVADARRGNVYAQKVRRSEDAAMVSYTELEAPRKLPRESLANEYPGLRVIEDVAPCAAALVGSPLPGPGVDPYYL